MKKVLALALGLTMAFGSVPVFADEVMNYSKYKVVTSTIENNRELNYMKGQLEDEIQDYNTAESKRVAAEYVDLEGDDEDQGNLTNYQWSEIKELNPLTSKYAKNAKQIEYTNKENALKLEAEKLYFSVMYGDELLQQKKSNFEFMKNRYEVKQQEFDLGKISQIDLMKFEKTYQETYVAYLNQEKTVNDLKNQLNQIMGQPINQAFTYTMIDVNSSVYQVEDMANLEARLLENSHQIAQLELSLESKEVERRLKGQYSGFGSTQNEIKILEDSMEELKYKIEDAKVNVAYQLASNYNTLEKVRIEMSIQELTYKIALSEYRTDSIKYENHMISEFDYMDSKQTFETSHYNYMMAKLNYYQEKQAFMNFVDENTVAYQ